jgi:hypothetical protein
MADEVIPMSAPDQTPVNPAVENDPEVLAERKKNLLMHLKLVRWQETATAIGFFIRTFKSEAVSLVSGVGTLVVGWFQIKKWVVQGRHVNQPQAQAQVPVLKTTAQGYGSGSGKMSAKHHAAKVQVVESAMVKDSSSTHMLEGIQGVPETGVALDVNVGTGFSDPMNSLLLALGIGFVSSTFAAWRKHKKKNGGSDGTV